MRQLLFWVGGSVIGTLLLSCTIGVAVTQFGGRDAVTVARDLGIFVIALMTWMSAVVGFAIWFGLAAGIGYGTGAMVRGLRWVAAKAAQADTAIADGLQRYVVRPTSKGAGTATAVKISLREWADLLERARSRARDQIQIARTLVRDGVRSATRRGTVVVETGVAVPED